MHWFADSPLLTLFFCVGVGSLFGRIRFGPISFGPAGALFAALALSAIEPDVALPPLVTSLSLCVFCYMVGVAAGPAFVSALRTGWQPVIVSLLAVATMAGAALGVGILIVRRHVPESPRWLFIHGREEESEQIVGQIEDEVRAETGEELPEVEVVDMRGARSLFSEELLRALGASRWQTLWRLQVPAGRHTLAAGLRVALVLAWVGTVVSEFISASRGLGAVIIGAQGAMDTALLFAALVLIALLGTASYGLLRALERRWASSDTHFH